LTPKILETLGLGAMCFLLLAFFKYWFINPVQALSIQSMNLIKKEPTFIRPKIKSLEFFYLCKTLMCVKRHLQNNAKSQNELEISNLELKNKNEQIHEKKKVLERAQTKFLETIEMAKKSDRAKEQFLRQVNYDLKKSVNTIIESSKNVLELLEILPSSSQNCALKKRFGIIYNAALELKSYARTNLKFEQINVKKLIDESLKISSKMSFDKRVNVILFVEEGLLIYADEFRVKQSLVSLLHNVIDNASCNEKVYVTCKSIILHEENYTHSVSFLGFR
jgi:signal transduction histidine kinase